MFERQKNVLTPIVRYLHWVCFTTLLARRAAIDFRCHRSCKERKNTAEKIRGVQNCGVPCWHASHLEIDPLAHATRHHDRRQRRTFVGQPSVVLCDRQSKVLRGSLEVNNTVQWYSNRGRQAKENKQTNLELLNITPFHLLNKNWINKALILEH